MRLRRTYCSLILVTLLFCQKRAKKERASSAYFFPILFSEIYLKTIRNLGNVISCLAFLSKRLVFRKRRQWVSIIQKPNSWQSGCCLGTAWFPVRKFTTIYEFAPRQNCRKSLFYNTGSFPKNQGITWHFVVFQTTNFVPTKLLPYTYFFDSTQALNGLTAAETSEVHPAHNASLIYLLMVYRSLPMKIPPYLNCTPFIRQYDILSLIDFHFVLDMGCTLFAARRH